MNLPRSTPLLRTGLAASLALLLSACASSSHDTRQDRRLVAAPIDEVRVLLDSDAPSGYAVLIRSGLPNGCAAFERTDLERDGERFRITVWNTLPADERVMCTMVYGTHTQQVALPGPLQGGLTHHVIVNGETRLDFTPD